MLKVVTQDEKKLLWTVLAFSVVLLGNMSCTPKDHVYRPFLSNSLSIHEDDPDCGGFAELATDGAELPATSDRAVLVSPAPKTLCSMISYRVPNSKAWAKVARRFDIAEPSQYTLAFVELPERSRVLPAPLQLDQLTDQLKGDQQDVIMVYVHGWRHDADHGNGNVQRFHTMLGYTRSALNQRCVDKGHYCGAKLTGVYVGWRGRSFKEPTKNNASPSGLTGSIWTAWGRKSQSERLAPADSLIPNAVEPTVIGHVLRRIEDRLALKHGDPNHDKMLVVGHSFGGNILATYMQPILSKKILNDHEFGSYMQPPLGDLVLLFNPAAEALKWTSLQKAMRERAKISPKTFAVGRKNSVSDEEWSKVKKWKGMFHKNQRPFYVSITSTDNWSSVETDNRSDERINFDKPTGLAFPIFQSIALRASKDERTTIGHLVPPYEPSDIKGRLTPSGPPYGASHEMITNSGIGKPTSYELSGDRNAAKCQAHDGWLTAAYNRQEETFKDNWDSGDGRAKTALLNKLNGAELQIRHSLWLKEKKEEKRGTFAESVSQGRSPFWNIRAYDTAVHGHSGFINFPTLCAVNILWLDDATATNFD